MVELNFRFLLLYKDFDENISDILLGRILQRYFDDFEYGILRNLKLKFAYILPKFSDSNLTGGGHFAPRPIGAGPVCYIFNKAN